VFMRSLRSAIVVMVMVVVVVVLHEGRFATKTKTRGACGSIGLATRRGTSAGRRLKHMRKKEEEKREKNRPRHRGDYTGYRGGEP